jgi:hypothetical protein
LGIEEPQSAFVSGAHPHFELEFRERYLAGLSIPGQLDSQEAALSELMQVNILLVLKSIAEAYGTVFALGVPGPFSNFTCGIWTLIYKCERNLGTRLNTRVALHGR